MITKEYFEKTFGSISNEEWSEFETWCKYRKSDGYHNAVGGVLSFQVVPSGDGQFVSAYFNTIAHRESGDIIYNEYGMPLIVNDFYNFEQEFR